MPFCPKCRGEYVEQTQACDDCGVSLVETLPAGRERTAGNAALVPVWHTHGEMDAQLIRSLLDSHGVESMIKGESLRLTHGFTLDGLAETKILVREDDAERARDVIASLDGMNRCPTCGYPVYDTDTACYSCKGSLES